MRRSVFERVYRLVSLPRNRVSKWRSPSLFPAAFPDGQEDECCIRVRFKNGCYRDRRVKHLAAKCRALAKKQVPLVKNC